MPVRFGQIKMAPQIQQGALFYLPIDPFALHQAIDVVRFALLAALDLGASDIHAGSLPQVGLEYKA